MKQFNIEVETWRNECWTKCPHFEPEAVQYLENGDIYFKHLRCEYVCLCSRIEAMMEAEKNEQSDNK